MFGCYFLSILIENNCLEYSIFYLKITSEGVDIFGISVMSKLLEIITEDNFIIVFFDDCCIGIIKKCCRKLEEEVFVILSKNFLNSIFSAWFFYEFAILLFLFGCCLYMVCFIGNKDDLIFTEIFSCQLIFFLIVEVAMEFLDSGEADIDRMGVAIFKIVYFENRDSDIINDDLLCKKKFFGCAIEKIVLGFGDDVVGIDEEEKISVSPLVKVKHKSCHDECFPTSCRHIETEMVGWCLFSLKLVVDIVGISGKCLYLIWTYGKILVEVVFDSSRNDFGDCTKLGECVEFFVEELCWHAICLFE